MNPKTKIKVAIDVAMTALLLLLMNLAWTGLLLHEIIGLAIVIFFSVHLLLNRQWISSVASRFSEIASKKTRFMFILNIMLGVAMLAAAASGVMISQYIFPGLADSNFDFWYSVHAVSSWLSLGVAAVHTVIHWKWIGSVIRRLAPTGQLRQVAGRLRVFAARALIGVFTVATVYSLVNGQLIDLLLPVTASTTSTVIVSTDDTDFTTVTIQPTTAATEEVVTLQEYLGNLFCTACHKHCLLSNPRCARGVRQADDATTEYNEALEDGTL